MVESTAAATRALSCGTGDRMENERTYLDAASALLDRSQSEHASPFEIVTEKRGNICEDVKVRKWQAVVKFKEEV